MRIRNPYKAALFMAMGLPNQHAECSLRTTFTLR